MEAVTVSDEHQMVMRAQHPGLRYEAGCSAPECEWNSHVVFTSEAEAMPIIGRRWREHCVDLARQTAPTPAPAPPTPAPSAPPTRATPTLNERLKNSETFEVLLGLIILGLLVWGGIHWLSSDSTKPGVDGYTPSECVGLRAYMQRDDIGIVDEADAIDDYTANC